ncbi:phosphodiester glycosidase family protein [Sphingobacterium hungaricum]
MKRETINFTMRKFMLLSIGTMLIASSCSRRDDYPNFDDKEVVEEVVDVIPPDNTISEITQKIIDQTSLIAKFQIDSTTEIAAGVQYTHMRFLNALDQPISMTILEIDRAQSQVSSIAMSPFNDVLYSTQFLADMAKDNEISPPLRIIAAINGDSFTTGIPTGSYIRYGRQIKVTTTTATVNTRPFFAVKKDGTMFIGNRVDATVPLDPYDLNDISHLVSGSNWLLYRGTSVENAAVALSARTAIGLSPTKLFSIVVDGDNPKFSVGLKLNDVRDVMKAIGAVDAFQLNAGQTSALVVRHQSNLRPITWEVKNFPTTPTGLATATGIGFLVK